MDSEPCPCRKTKCPRHSDCVACREYHKTSKYLPACERKTLFGRKNKERDSKGEKSDGA